MYFKLVRLVHDCDGAGGYFFSHEIFSEKLFLLILTPKNKGLVATIVAENMQDVPADPRVKSGKTCKMSNAGVTGNLETGKSADPACYDHGTVEFRTGLFENVENDMTTQYPAGGPREPVYALMRRLGLSESNWSDKFWKGADGIEVAIFCAGSMARIRLDGNDMGECELADLNSRIDAIRAA